MTDIGSPPPAIVPVSCLGSGEYRAVVRHRRTPKKPAYTLGELTPRSLNWGRALSATSVADITVPVTGDAARCCELIRNIGVGRAVMDIYRDDDLVWMGTCKTKAVDPDTGTVTLYGADLSVWLEWRLFHHKLTPRGIDLADIFAGYLSYLLKGIAPSWCDLASSDVPLYQDDPGLEWVVTPTGIEGDRTIDTADLRVGSVELEELSRTGCDWTVTNSKMWVGGTELLRDDGPPLPMRLPGHVTDEFFAAAPRTRETIEGSATEMWLRGNGVKARAGGPDPDDGVLIQRVLDEYSIEDQSSANAAVQSAYDLSKNPLTFIEGDNALAASAPLDIQTLIPGTRTSVALAGGGCIPYEGMLRLDRVQVNQGAEDGEKVTMTMQPLGSSYQPRGG